MSHCSWFLKNQMVRFDILNCSVFLIQGPSVLLVASSANPLVQRGTVPLAEDLRAFLLAGVERIASWFTGCTIKSRNSAGVAGMNPSVELSDGVPQVVVMKRSSTTTTRVWLEACTTRAGAMEKKHRLQFRRCMQDVDDKT
jgi:hypothetical protein